MDAKVSLISIKDNTTVSMTTTRTGSYDFSITSEEAKDYTLSVEKDGYATQSSVVSIVGATDKANSDSRSIELKKATEEPKAVTKKDPVAVKFSVRVVDATSKQALDAKVSLTSVKDNKTVASANAGTGSYDFAITAEGSNDYRLSVEKEGYIFQNTVVSISKAGARTIELRKPSVGVSQILHNIYFDFNKATFKQESYDELGKLETMMKQNSAMKLEIAGHTDSFGSDFYNKQLSLARASAVRNFLTSKGIDVKRVNAAGYGDTRPLGQ